MQNAISHTQQSEPKQAHYLQHVPFEGLAAIEPWLDNNGYHISATRLYLGEKLPKTDEIDLLIIMGGPMSVHDEADYPWLVEEKQFIKQLIKQGCPILGICLGSQLIASVSGASVFPNQYKEIGWFPIERAVSSEQADVFQFPDQTNVFHWHGETFDLPDNAVRLASSTACINQAFQLGRNIIGLQFHLETTPASAAAIVSNCAGELIEAPYIQSAATITQTGIDRYQAINQLLMDVMAYLTR